MRLPQFGSLLLALSIGPLTTLPAQEPAKPDTQQMTIHVTVSSRNSEPVNGLTKDDFTLFDNKHQEPITEFQAVNTTPTSIIIVLDAVNVPYSQLSFARQQLANFFSSNDGHLAQPTTLGVLQDKGLEIQPNLTTDGNALRATLDHLSIGLREITRSAGFYGADERLQISLTAFQRLIEQLPREGAKRIVWISPGWPLLSGPAVDLSTSDRTSIFNQVVAINTRLRQSNIVVDAVNPLGSTEDLSRVNYYEVFLRSPRRPNDVDIGDTGLQVIAQQSGGLVLNGSNDIAVLLQRAVAQTKGGYNLTFTSAPGEHNNEYHELQVKVRKPGLVVHTTAGYYAKPIFGPLPQPVPQPTMR